MKEWDRLMSLLKSLKKSIYEFLILSRRYANRLDPDKTQSYSTSHPHPSCFTLWQHFQTLCDIEVLWKLKQNGKANNNQFCRLLFISYKSVKGFLAKTFSLLFFSNWNFHDVCQRFLYNQKWNFSWIWQNTKIFPIDPHYKNRLLL